MKLCAVLGCRGWQGHLSDIQWVAGRGVVTNVAPSSFGFTVIPTWPSPENFSTATPFSVGRSLSGGSTWRRGLTMSSGQRGTCETPQCRVVAGGSSEGLARCAALRGD